MADSALNPHDLRRVAVAAGCDPRTVRARLEGRRQHSTVTARIDDALRSLGFQEAPREQPEGPQAA